MGSASMGRVMCATTQFMRKSSRFSALLTMPPPGGDHLPAHERNAPERLRLAAAEPRLALGFKDARNGHARRLFDFPVQIHKRHAQPRRRQRAHGALARARHAHQRKARHRAPERPLGLPRALRGHGQPVKRSHARTA